MRAFGLVGKKLSHSFSPNYFKTKFEKEGIDDVTYHLFPLENINELIGLVKNNANLIGLNVTIPYKEEVIPLLDDLDPDVEKIGAVNTIKVFRDAEKPRLIGFNTDITGFRKSLEPLLHSKIKKALILGTGGASKAVSYALMRLGIDFSYVSRSPQYDDDIAYSDLNEEIISEHKLIVNTTPLGMYPNNDGYPDIPYEFIGEEHVLYDLVYNPEETIFMLFGKKNGARVKNGLEMLQLQADEAWKIWNL